MPTTRPVRSSSSALESRLNDQPGLKQLRSSLVGARIDLLKTTAFASTLFLIVAAIVHHGHFASSDNQFAANAGAALTALEGTVSVQGDVLAASARTHTDSLTAAARAKVDSAAAQVGTALKSSAKPAPVSTVPVKVAAVRLHTAPLRHEAIAALPTAHLLKVSMPARRMVEHPVNLAAIHRAPAKSAQALLHGDLTLDAVDKAADVLGTESSKAYYAFLNFIQGCTDMASVASVRSQAQSWMISTVDKFTSSGSFAVNDPASFIANAFTVDSAVTVAAAILFVVVCMGMFAQVRSGLRGVGGRSGI